MVETQPSRGLTGKDSHLPFPIISALITLLLAAGFRNLPEAIPFVAAGGTAATLIFTAESAIWLMTRRTTRNTKA